jgi:transcriptional regulator with XRE-family HTH domain
MWSVTQTVDADIDATLAAVGPRLRELRKQREMTLAHLADATGITVSTLSRLESGLRRPSLDLLLPIAQAHGVSIDDLVRGQTVRDPRVRPVPTRRHGMTFIPLTSDVGGLQAFKVILPGRRTTPQLRTHRGYEWLYVLSGSLRLRIGEHDLTMGPGEAAEFDTRNPHWFGTADGGRVELLTLFSHEGERLHVRATTGTHPE